MLKLAIIVGVLFWLARALGRFVPRIEIHLEGPAEDVRVLSVMREHFPDAYERYKKGLLSPNEERSLVLDCVEILGAREEIERL